MFALSCSQIVVDSNTWLSNLPHSIEAMFIVDCKPGQRNTPYSASRTCDGAHAMAKRVHQAFIAEYGLSEKSFPLLRLTATEWDAPFSAA